MNTRSIFLSLVFTLLVAANVSSAIEPKTGPAAFGQGEFTFNGELIRFSFEAHANQKNHTRGRAIFDNLTNQTQVVVKIDCLRVDSFEALITGDCFTQ